MKKTVWMAMAFVAVMTSCSRDNQAESSINEKGPIMVESPCPDVSIPSLVLDQTQKSYSDAGNRMGFRLLEQLYEGGDVFCSPLSLQYALAMTANGASGETLREMVDFLGYGDDVDAMNAYCKMLLEQLPAVDLDVILKATDALLVKDDYMLIPSFEGTVQDNYYAAVENDPFDNPAEVAAWVNEWARRCTNGFLDDVLSPEDIRNATMALIMNALYFKAKWAERPSGQPMFMEGSTKDRPFTRTDGTVCELPTMPTGGWFPYSERDGYRVLALPYAGGKYYMYFLLPDKNDIAGLLAKLPSVSWSEVLGSLRRDKEVHVLIPRFEVERKYYLKQHLQAMGLKRAFTDAAQFDRMFVRKNGVLVPLSIGQVIQKAHVAVDEWGTEAAAVTVVEIRDTDPGPGGDKPEPVYFYADHPFVFAIGEVSSGVLLFQGVYTGN